MKILARVVVYVGFVSCALSGEAAVLYSSSDRFEQSGDGILAGIQWYGGATCQSQPSFFAATGRNAPSLSSACDAMGKTKLNLQPQATDPNWCTTYRTNISYFRCGSGAFASTLSACNISVEGVPRGVAAYAPKFVVRSIDYQMPGNKSSVVYTDGRSNGSTWSTSVTAGTGADATVKWNASLTFGSGYKVEVINKTKTSLQRTSQLTETLTFSADQADHSKDVISIWVNPMLTEYTQCGSAADGWLEYGVASQIWISPAYDPKSPVTMDFTVGELMHPETVTDSYRAYFLSMLTQDDIRTGILALNPFIDQATWTINPNPVLNSNRFRPVQGGACPRNLPDPVTAFRSIACRATYSDSLDKEETFNAEWNVSIGFKMLNGSFDNKYSLKYSRTLSESTGHNNSAEIRLATTTPGICISGQLAIDTMFNVYVMSGYQYACQTL